MTARRNLKFSGLRLAAAALLAGLALTALPGVAGSAAAGSNISSRVTVQIVRPAGVIGLQELSNAQGFLTAPDSGGADPLTQAASPARRGAVAPPSSGGALAAAIAISGAPNQSFSLTLTDSLVVVTDTGELVVTNFDHNAGNSPTIGGDGAAQIAARWLQQCRPDSQVAKRIAGNPATVDDQRGRPGPRGRRRRRS